MYLLEISGTKKLHSFPQRPARAAKQKDNFNDDVDNEPETQQSKSIKVRIIAFLFISNVILMGLNSRDYRLFRWDQLLMAADSHGAHGRLLTITAAAVR